jgi:membrane complex biogenesis BtpA family protein
MGVRIEDGAELRLMPLLGYKPLIGMIHLPPLPSSRILSASIDRLVEYALWEAGKLRDAGFTAVLVENYNDAPYHERVSDPLTLAAMAIIVREIVRAYPNVIVGVNLLRNSGPETIAIASMAGAKFIRVNAYCEPRLSMEGILKPLASDIEDLRSKLKYNVLVLADVDVKHSWPLGNYNLEQVVKDCVKRGKPDALVVSSSATGEAPEPGYVASIRMYAGTKPIIVGSGITLENIEAYWNIADGFIVGTSIKQKGITTNPVDEKRARELAEKVEELKCKDLRRIGLQC